MSTESNDVNRLPSKFVEEGLQIAESCTVFGIPMTSLSRDELLAAAAQATINYTRHLEQSIASARLMRDLRTAASR